MRPVLFSALAAALFFLAHGDAHAQQKQPALSRVLEEKKTDWLLSFREFLRLPNIASDSAGIRRNAKHIMEMMQQRGIANVRLLEADHPATPPAVYGEVRVPGAKQTLVFYAHYDGQPVNPAQWAPGLQPFTPVLYSGAIPGRAGAQPLPFPEKGKQIENDWRIYARGASDDKAGVAGLLYAYEAIRAAGLSPAVNIKFFFEGEEEAGSEHLPEILQKHASLLQSDGWIICDGPVHQSGRRQVVFGVRGDAHLILTVYGPRRPLHSGHYGNWVPNPALTLAKLLAGMKNDSGRVTIKGFYDDVLPLTDAEKKALAAVPPVERQMKEELGFGREEQPGLSLMEAINQPSLNINGMSSGNVGKMASNMIPTTAEAVLDLRLVPGNDWQRQQQKLIDHIREQGFTVIDHEPTEEERASGRPLVKAIPGKDGYNAQRTDMTLPLGRQVIAAVQSTSREPVVLVPSLGGSLPLYVFEKYLDAKTVIVPIANHDNNQHAENENIRLGNFWQGIETYAAIMLLAK